MHTLILLSCLHLIELYLPETPYKKELSTIILLETSCGILEKESRAGAKGIAQIMPDTAKWLWPKCDMEGEYSEKLLDDRKINLTLANCFVIMLSNKYDNWSLIAAHYNGGYRQVDLLKQLKPLTKETANYVVRFKYILDLYTIEARKYKKKSR